MGGNTMINGLPTTEMQLQELKRISPHISALIDSERAQEDDPLPKDRLAFLDLCQRTGVRCHVLRRRALENYWNDAAVSATCGSAFRALQPFQQLKEISPSWPKANNWQIARAMQKSDLVTTDLGVFLNDL